MKKLVLGVCALFICFMLASCGGSPTDKIKSITEDIEKNGDEWTDWEKWDEVQVEVANCLIEFAESAPTEEEFEEFREAIEDLAEAANDIDDKAAKIARDKADDKFGEEHKDLKDDLEKANRKLTEIAKMYMQDDDDDDDDEVELDLDDVDDAKLHVTPELSD